jgi:hypothetical protein
MPPKKAAIAEDVKAKKKPVPSADRDELAQVDRFYFDGKYNVGYRNQ